MIHFLIAFTIFALGGLSYTYFHLKRQILVTDKS